MIFDGNIEKSEVNNYEIDRGKIYDRTGQLLSTNIKTHSLYVNSKKIKNKNTLALQLSKILGIKKKILLKKLNLNKSFVYLKRNISPKEHQKIIEIGEINLGTHQEKRRVYPFKNTGSHLIGYVDIDNKGLAGIEAGFDNLLNSGNDIYLTINIHLQNAIRNELIQTVEKFSAESASAIIMDINSFEILSLINYPDFDPNNVQKSSSEQRINRVLQSNYAMGSTFKPLTVAMGIDKELINKDMIFDVSEPIKNTITDWDPCKCSLSVKEIIVRSSNIGTAKIAEIIGKENQIEFFKKLGFFEPVNTGMIESAKPLGNRYNWGKIETMTIGYGHGFAITPMHLAVAYSGLLNDGKKLDPKFLLNSKDFKFEKIVKKQTSQYISTLLRAVIEETEFTGPRVRIEGYDIGGKTGTAELLDSNGNYNKDLNRTIFVGAFPMSKPKFLILTFVDKPKRIKEENHGITSARVNAPLVKNIILRMIEILNLTKSTEEIILNAATSINYQNTNVINWYFKIYKM